MRFDIRKMIASDLSNPSPWSDMIRVGLRLIALLGTRQKVLEEGAAELSLFHRAHRCGSMAKARPKREFRLKKIMISKSIYC